jgi:hypothetical protein
VDGTAQARRIIARIPGRPACSSARKVVDRPSAAGVARAGSVRRPRGDTLECSLSGGRHPIAVVSATTRDRNDLPRRRLRQSWPPPAGVFGANRFVVRIGPCDPA